MLDEDVKKRLDRINSRPRRKIYVGRRNGKKVWMTNRSLTLQQLRCKYPGGVIPVWKVNIIKIVNAGRYNVEPWFCDILTGMMKWIIR